MTIEALEDLLEQLVREGRIQDGTTARRRILLGFPAWMVLSELTADQLEAELAAAGGVAILQQGIAAVGVDIEACNAYGMEQLQENRWVPLSDGRIAIADPFRLLPDGPLAERQLCLASHEDVDTAFERTFPALAAAARQRRRLGRYLLDSGAVNEQGLAEALQEQTRSGGRLGEILVSNGIAKADDLTTALAARIGLQPVPDGAKPIPLLPRDMAHELRAVAIEPPAPRRRSRRAIQLLVPVKVAFSNPSEEKLATIARKLGRPVEAQVTDDETLDALLAALYSQEDVQDVVSSLRQQLPNLSAYQTGLSPTQLFIAIEFVLLLFVSIAASPRLTAIGIIAVSTLIYVLYTSYRLFSAWRGWRSGSTLNPSYEDLEAMDGHDLPDYTVLLPVFREKRQTLTALFEALSNLDYPKHKLNGLLLVESDDTQTQDAMEEMAELSIGGRPLRPAWLKTLLIPPGGPRTKPKAMIYGLLYATGELLTIFDAEDKPEPDQLKKAAWAFLHADANVACIQAKLSYYNSRQNLLTRWFTLEYAAWFEMFLPGLHAMGAPIPLGGTSNHFRLDLLKQVLSWDPYNVTEDADLGLRFTRAGYRTNMLESTTFEEANSDYGNWLRQRSRWIKGYMQTFLVHTRQPLTLYRELGAVNSIHFMATVGGLIFTVVISPLFWLLLVAWLLFQPGWIPSLFPGPVYYMAMASLVFGNFCFVFLALVGAVGRGQDDLSPYTLIFPIYWLMMSCAAYVALYELVRKPHYWQKTEHGLHLTPDVAAAPAPVTILAIRSEDDEEIEPKAA